MKTILFFIFTFFGALSMAAQSLAYLGHHDPSNLPVQKKKASVTHSPSTVERSLIAYTYQSGDDIICSNAPRPGGLVYRIQFEAKKGLLTDKSHPSEISEMGPIYPEWMTERNVTRFLLGDFQFSGDAQYTLEKIHALGYPHAFVVTYKEGIRQP